jgi:hypothetical protein
MFIDPVYGNNNELFWIGQVHGRANVIKMNRGNGYVKWGVKLHEMS